MRNKWIAHERFNEDAKINLICIPYAGASANMFGNWKYLFPEKINVLPLLFPMREMRISEKMPETVEKMAREFFEDSKELFNKKVLIFGHCTGAILAYEIAKTVKALLGKDVFGIIASSSNEPGMMPEEMRELASANDNKLIEYLKKEKLVEDELLEDEDFCTYYLPLLHADFDMYGAYKASRKKKLKCPIITIYDENDKKISKDAVHAWADYTQGNYSFRQVDGGHYYIKNPENVIKVLNEFIEKANN
ncbi:Surfactin synthase thioesterase subunit [Acetitomaculum ruminis DSM 5522]|uniref:Surfactin synthase thioesterase subunit n=1 Tax=Acetitomaculum ruminis DSM 5522 TaxID=1120918 RepID=A0A1I0X8F7_9FIRM|nr:thioesterase domain-containing protein [Acetitomaculum ruminis]SFA97315.1 Surfactin synthase thioesterase subunit [Acetitomaculum ruminis DSM 5522]